MPGRVGPYEVADEIGRGGMAVVYLARQPALDRMVALKELAPFHVGEAFLARRFLQEARMAGSLNHSNVVTVYDFLEHDGVPYIAMEYLERGSLRPAVGRLTLPQVAGVLEGLLAGLSHAEGMGIAHRDLKPENLLITADGGIKIADFGIAKAYHQVAATDWRTPTGSTVGTPAYMAPEQAMAQEIGPWTDLYQAGVIAYELLSGSVPFTSTDSPLAVLMQHVNERPPELPRDVDPALAAWVERMMAKAPSDRPSSARAAWHALEEPLIDLLGPLWRRAARLGPPDPTVEHPLSLSPAPFPSPPVTPRAEPDAPAEQYETYEPPPPPRPPAAEPPPPAAPPPDAPPPSPEPPPPAEPGPPSVPEPELDPARAPTLPGTPPTAPATTRAEHPSRRVPIVGLLSLAAVGALVAIAALLIRGGENPPSSAPTPAATERPNTRPVSIPIGSGPDGLAVGEGAAWVADSEDGTLTRVDETSRETSTVVVGPNPDSVAVGSGSVWVSATGADELVRVTPGERPEVLESIDVGDAPEGVAVTDRAAWVANSGDRSLTQFRLSSQTTHHVDVGGRPVGLAIGAGAVWVADSAGSLVRVHGGRLQVVARIDGIGRNPRAVAIIDRSVFVVTAGDGRVWRIDGDANEITGSVRVGANPRAIATDGRRLWIVDHDRDRLVEVDPEAMRVVRRTRVPDGPIDVAVGDGAVWVTSLRAGQVTRVPR